MNRDFMYTFARVGGEKKKREKKRKEEGEERGIRDVENRLNREKTG